MSDRAATPPGFSHHVEQLADVRLHYVRGGSGPPVVLLHGWSQTWYEWRRVMPALAERYTVIAPDLRGLGDSSKPLTGYDKRTVAGDVHELAGRLGFERVALVGHDHGAAVAYAYAAAHRDSVERLAFLEMLPMGAGGELGLDHSSGQGLWHLSFHALGGEVAEALIRGRERMYLSWFYGNFAYDRSAIDEAALDEYTRCYSAPGGLRLEYYRAFFEDAEHVRESMQEKLTIPVLALGGDACLGGLPLESMRLLAGDVRGGSIPRCGHFVPEERPDELLEHLLPFLAGAPRRVTVGWIGLGEMGLPMAANLVASGRPVLGYDRDEARLASAAAAGIELAGSIAELAVRAEVVVSMVRTVAQTEEVLAGKGGLAASAAEGGGLVVAVMSTLEPRSLRRLAAETAPGLTVVDAPVSGGVRGAEAGTLSIMASGPAAALERLRPLFDVLGRPVEVGAEPGLGQAAKLANQVMMAVNMAGVLEGLRVARAYGVSEEAVLATVGAGTGASWVLAHWDWMTSLWEQYVPGNALDVLVKDLRAVVAETAAAGLDAPVTSLAFDRLMAEWGLA